MKPMTAQEAWDNCAYYSCIPTVADRDGVDLRHAMKIMDALVASHNARCACGEVQDAEPFDGEAFRVSWERLCELDGKLRALEAGEDPQ